MLAADLEQFAAAVRRENHTLKRALTDPKPFSGIGNAYSDEILHAARLSPVTSTRRMEQESVARLYAPYAADAMVDRAPRRGRRPGRSRRRSRRFAPRRPSTAASPAVPRAPDAGGTHTIRRQRDELLRALPDRWPPARGPRAVAAAEAGSAQECRSLRSRIVRMHFAAGASVKIGGPQGLRGMLKHCLDLCTCDPPARQFGKCGLRSKNATSVVSMLGRGWPPVISHRKNIL